eukprot:CAMPEP_0183716102 /NCGR_PEP_ID=MMETSP0737-20130205/10118_1 /TAXON_ID=385413 /ORGANISM="Thalassiosira miniscula, Strain CCMP1093" /LENGTH=619 /DNA_ID=CAMNT_0025945313 /DNA_START=37 /DNA_END=1896 /DNA_ORIENTATION=+
MIVTTTTKTRRMDDVAEGHRLLLRSDPEEAVPSRLFSSNGNASGQSSPLKRRAPASASAPSALGAVSSSHAPDDIESQAKSPRVKITKSKSHNNGRRLFGGNQQPKAGAAPPSGSGSDLAEKIQEAILTNIDDEVLQDEDTHTIVIIITIIKEALLGMMIACLLAAFVLILRDARGVRESIDALLHNDQVLQIYQESSGLKLMTVDEYQELPQMKEKSQKADILLRSKTEDHAKLQDEITALQSEQKHLMSKLGLDAFCHDCLYDTSTKTTCDDHVHLLMERNQFPRANAMIMTMDAGDGTACRIMDPEAARKRQIEHIFEDLEHLRVAAVQSYVGRWDDVHRANFCSDCEYKDNESTDKKNQQQQQDGGSGQMKMTCSERAATLTQTFHVNAKESFAQVLLDSRQCHKSYYQDTIDKLGGFCKDCRWGYKKDQTCDAYAEYLSRKHHLPRLQAEIFTMEKELCRGSNGDDGGNGRESNRQSMAIFDQYHQQRNDIVQKIAENMSTHQTNFCADCKWKGRYTTCAERAATINQRYNKSAKESFAETMLESEYCRRNYYTEKMDAMGGFCKDCLWGYKRSQTCGAWAKYLMEKRNMSRLAAEVSAMEKEACRGGGGGGGK